MGHPEQPDDWDASRLDKVSGLSNRVLFIASGLVAPDTGRAQNVSVVGYQPEGRPDPVRSIQWGLQFAPFDRAGDDPACRIMSRAVIALGGAENTDTVSAILSALAEATFIDDIVYLGSPIGNVVPDETLISRHQSLSVQRNLTEIHSLIQSAGILIVSYGNLMFEALALCTPTCVLGIKPFQAQYARNIEELGLAVSIDDTMPDHARVAAALSRLQASKDLLIANCRSTFRGSGFDALAALVLAELDEA